jgi:hypothetical protein
VCRAEPGSQCPSEVIPYSCILNDFPGTPCRTVQRLARRAHPKLFPIPAYQMISLARRAAPCSAWLAVRIRACHCWGTPDSQYHTCVRLALLRHGPVEESRPQAESTQSRSQSRPQPWVAGHRQKALRAGPRAGRSLGEQATGRQTIQREHSHGLTFKRPCRHRPQPAMPSERGRSPQGSAGSAPESAGDKICEESRKGGEKGGTRSQPPDTQRGAR